MSNKSKKGLLRLEVIALAGVAVVLVGAVILTFAGGYACPGNALFDAVSAITNSGFSVVDTGGLNAVAKATLMALQIYGKANLAAVFFTIGAMTGRQHSNGQKEEQ